MNNILATIRKERITEPKPLNPIQENEVQIKVKFNRDHYVNVLNAKYPKHKVNYLLEILND